jgi:hypothetical protein
MSDKSDRNGTSGALPLVISLTALGLGAGAVGYLFGSRGVQAPVGPARSDGVQSSLVFNGGGADPKVQQAYVRSGVSERIMTQPRRVKLGSCYQEFVVKRGEGTAEEPVEGKISVVFEIAENGVMKGYEVIDNELGDDDLQACLEGQLEGLRFLPPPLGINRFIVYDFMFKKDETVRREMEERNSRPALELIPTTPDPGGQQQPVPPAPPAPAAPAPAKP